tara:strand:- start:509 stop:916 length:408 start_codon:yes stop_codon:yes gene_type:complete
MVIYKSPKYFGKIASNYNLNDTEIGYDNNIWQVIIKNNRYVWARQSEDLIVINNLITKNNKIICENKIDNDKKNKKKKYTQYNEYLEIKMKELKDTNISLTPKELFCVAVKEWHIIKNNKEDLSIFLNQNKKNDI